MTSLATGRYFFILLVLSAAIDRNLLSIISFYFKIFVSRAYKSDYVEKSFRPGDIILLILSEKV